MQHTLSYFALALQRDFSDFCNEKLGNIGLSRGNIYFLIYVGKHPDCSPGVLAAALHYDTGHTARSIEKLVQIGFVHRQKNPMDKRVYKLHLTERGEQAFLAIRQLFGQWDAQALADMNEKDTVDLLALLENIRVGKWKISHE